MAGKIKFYLVNQTKYSETYMWCKEVLITFWKKLKKMEGNYIVILSAREISLTKFQ